MSNEYTDSELQRLLAEDTGIAELGIDVRTREDVIVLSGRVESAERRDTIERTAIERFNPRRVVNEIAVVGAGPPTGAEEVTG